MCSMSFDSKDRDALLRPTDLITVRPSRNQQQPSSSNWNHPWSNINVHNGTVCCPPPLPPVWLTSEPIVDPRVDRRLAPHADLIELVSSTENLSLCGSTSSAEYRSCDEEDGGDGDLAAATEQETATAECLRLDDLSSEENGCCISMGTTDVVPRVVVDDHGLVDCIEEGLSFLPSGDVGPPFVKRLPQCPSSAQLSVASSNSDPMIPTCRICHLAGGGTGGDDHDNGLISPCRCSGTMQYIHNACLMKWLEVSSRKSKRPPSCELCLFQYHRHKKFKGDHWKFPKCTLRDKILHMLFFLSLIMMIGSATVTILCFKHDKALGHRTTVTAAATSTTSLGAGGSSAITGFDRNRLTHSEVVTLVCGVLFFVAFFLAMYVEVKSRSTVYKLITDFLYLNQQWHIDEYDKKMDM